MKEFKIIEIMGNFDLLVNTKVKANDREEAKKEVMKHIQEHINEYMYAVVEEVK